MRSVTGFLILCFGLAATLTAADDAASSYLAYRFGGSATVGERHIHPNPDNWMLAGPLNRAAIQELQKDPEDFSKSGTYLTTIANTIVFIEIRDRKVDPTVNLEALYLKQKQLVARFLYSCLLQDKTELAKLVTHPENVTFGGAPAVGGGDMDQYSVILAEMPPYRISTPVEDSKTRTVTYRVPIGSKGFLVNLLLKEGAWKIDTQAKTDVPLGIFFQ